jgi:hypothetical protein
MDNKVESFCVVCVCDDDVLTFPHWEVESAHRVDVIARSVASAAEKFGRGNIDVRIIEIVR